MRVSGQNWAAKKTKQEVETEKIKRQSSSDSIRAGDRLEYEQNEQAECVRT